MEEIINYKLKDFFLLTDIKQAEDYLSILSNLNPLKEIKNPRFRWYRRKQTKFIRIPSILEMKFGEVTQIRNSFSSGNIEGIIESVMILTKLKRIEILNFTIVTFYGIISSIKRDLERISNMEFNELSSDEDDINLEIVRAGERMSRYGVLNVFDNLSGGDITKWKEIEQIPFMSVFTKLSLDNTKSAIQKEISELQKKQMKK